MTNWNKTSPRASARPTTSGAAPDRSPRVDLLDQNLSKLNNKKGKWNLASVTSAMNAAATQDVRAIDTVPLLANLLKGSKPPTDRPRRC